MNKNDDKNADETVRLLRLISQRLYGVGVAVILTLALCVWIAFMLANE